MVSGKNSLRWESERIKTLGTFADYLDTNLLVVYTLVDATLVLFAYNVA